MNLLLESCPDHHTEYCNQPALGTFLLDLPEGLEFSHSISDLLLYSTAHVLCSLFITDLPHHSPQEQGPWCALLLALFQSSPELTYLLIYQTHCTYSVPDTVLISLNIPIYLVVGTQKIRHRIGRLERDSECTRVLESDRVTSPPRPWHSPAV